MQGRPRAELPQSRVHGPAASVLRVSAPAQRARSVPAALLAMCSVAALPVSATKLKTKDSRRHSWDGEPPPKSRARSPLPLQEPPMRATISDCVQALAPELPAACAPLPRRAPDNGHNPQHAIARLRARRPRGCHRTTLPTFPRRDSSRAPSHRRTIVLRFLAVLPTPRYALRRGRLHTQELAKVERAWVLADGAEAGGNLGGAQAA